MTLWISPSGGIGAVPPDIEANALALGYVPASPEQIADFELQAKHGGIGSQIATAAESAASALTFGASPHIEKALGIEGISERERTNPLASAVGTAAGIALPLLAGGVGGLTAPGLISKAGGAAARATAEALPEAATLLGRVGAAAAKSAAGAATEGALYGVGSIIHEAALGEPNLTAQSLLAHVGGVGLLTGGLGGAVGMVGKLLGEGAKKLPGWLEGIEAHANLQAAGGDKVLARKLRNQFGEEGSRKILLEMRDLGIVDGPLATPASVMDKAKAVIQENGEKIGAMLRAADTAEADVGAALAARGVLDKGLALAERLEANPFTESAARTLQDVLAKYEAKFSVASPTLSDLHSMEREFGAEVFGLKGMRDPRATPLIDSLNHIRRDLSSAVDAGVERAGIAGEEWDAANRAYTVAKRAEAFAQNGLDRLAGNNPLSLTGTLGGLAGFGFAGPLAGVASAAATELGKRYGSGATGYLARVLREGIESGAADALANKTAAAIAAERVAGMPAAAQVVGAETAATLGKMQQTLDAVAGRIEAAVTTLVRSAPRAASVGRSEAAAGIAKVFGAADSDAFASRVGKIERLVADPEAFAARLDAHAADLRPHAPQTAQALTIASARAAQFLASKIPRPPPGRGPLAPAWKPSQAQIAQYLRYDEAVRNPLVVLKQAASGTLTREAIEAVRTVYPDLMLAMQAALTDRLASARAKPTYQARLGISAILGHGTDGSMMPTRVASTQTLFAARKPPAQPPPSATRSRTPPAQVGGAYMTPTQRAASRAP